jgi:HrpA-like RNA helicase
VTPIKICISYIHERIASHPPQYPCLNAEKEILYAVEHNDVVMISAETGSGKTTRMFSLIQKYRSS